MADSTFRVNFGFTADTAQAEASLQDLQAQLDKLIRTTSTKSSGAGLTKEIQNAVTAAAELKAHLQNATNVQTGVLDFSKLNDSIQRSGKSLMDYGDELLKLGPAGEESFKSLARSVASSEIPLKRTSKMVNDLWVSLKNAARWQVSASVLHGFMGALQTSYHYAQDLNESLNNIRIVTGQSTEQMAKFAEQANKTARSLSASTLDYTNASLIYYQQGLDDKQVEERTNVTIKMANAAGVSAEEVSNQMTAVWNNFDNGSKSLEYYADVMTALGAATASSTSEIATGLEKFAAVSETVGLSYEYATAALATVTATTRQNADIVGNAFKTLFARIQGLNLGETLDDGTTLNKYSEALAKVGISIMDQNGQMKEMDTILDEMGAKWGTLDKAQQTALAQTVAGVRQYTQLIALMDNWDFFQENLGVALGSEGTLTKQAEIYAESWEAAEKRVQAAAEAIYQDLLNDEFFIDLTNGVEGFLVVLDKFIDGIGGVKGVLLGLGAIATKVFEKQIASGLNSMVYTIKMSTKVGQEAVLKQRSAILSEMSDVYVSMQGGGSEAEIRAQNLQRELQLTDGLAQKIDMMNSTEQLRAKELLNIVQLQGESVVKAQEELNVKKDQLVVLKNQIKESAILKNPKGMDNPSGGVDAWLKRYQKADTGFNTINDIFKQLGNKTKLTEDQLNNVKKALNNIGDNKQIKILVGNLDEAQNSGKNLKDILINIRKEFDTKRIDASSRLQKKFDVDPKILQDYFKTLQEISQAEVNVQAKQEMYQKATDDFENRILNSQKASSDWATNLVNNANKISTVVFSFQSLVNVIDTLKNPDVSGWDKFTTALTGISFAIPGLVTGFKSLINVIQAVNAAIAVNKAFTSLSVALQNEENIATKEKIISDILKSKGIDNVTLSQEKYGGATLSAVLAERAQRDTSLEAAAASLVEEGAIKANTASKIKNISITSLLHLKTLLLVAAFAAVGVAIYAVGKAYNADADAAKEAAEAAQQAKDSFEQTKSSVEELKASLTNIDESHKALENMTKGTDEWRKAVTNLNDEVLKLIDTYPALAAAVKETDGVLFIDKTSQAYKDFIKQQDEFLEKSRQSYLGAAITANQKQDQADITNFKRKINASTEDTWVTDQSGNSYYSPNGDLSSDQLKAVIQILQDSNNSALKSIDTFRQAIFDAKIKLNDEQLIQALYDNKSGLIELSNSIQSNKVANDLFNQQIAKSYLQNDFSYQTSSNQTAIEKALAEQLSGVDTSTWGTQYDGNYQQDYASKMGYTFVGEKDGKIEYLYNGESIKVSAAEAKYTLNQDKFLDTEASSVIEGVNSLLSGITDEDTKALINAAITGNYKGLTDKQLAMELGEGQSVETWLENILGSQDKVDTATKLFGEDFIANLEATLTASADSIPEDPFNLSSWTKTFKEIKDLNIGGTIDPEIFNLLDANMQQFFTETEDGTYMLMMAADQLKAKLKETLIEDIKTQQGQIDVGQAAMGVYSEDIGESALGYSKEGYVNTNLLEAQMAFLESQGVDTSEYKDSFYEDGKLKSSFNIDLVNQLAEAAGALKVEFDGLGASVTQEKEKLAMSAGTVDELDDWFASGLISEKQRDEALPGAIFKEAESLDIDYKEVQEYGEYLRKNVDELENSVELSERLALNEKKQAKGLNNLIENYEEYSNALKTADRTSDTYSKALNAMKKDVKLLLATNHDFEDEFFQDPEVLQAIEDVANGVDGAYGKLEALATKQIMIDMGIDDTKITQEMLDTIASLSEMAIGSNFTITPQLDNSNALDGLYDLLTQAGLTATQIMDIFREIGWEPKLEYETLDITGFSDQESFGYQQVAVLQPDGSYAIETMDLAGAQAIAQDGKILVPKIVSATKVGGGGVSNPPPINRGGGGGGGGSQRKPPEKKSDISKERYHTITNQLEDLKSEYEDIAEASDRAFGQDKLDNMDAEIAKTDELISKQKEYLAAIEENLPMDRDIMTAYYNQLIGGPGIEFDEKGNISNFDAIQDAMYARYNANTTALGEEDWEVFEEKYKKLEEYIKQYEETYDLLRDEEQEYQDLINQRLDAQLEKIEYEVDLKLNISDDALEVLEFQLDRLEDDAFKAAETIALQSEKAEKIYDKVQFNQEGIDKILKNHNLNVDAFYEGLYSETELLATGFTENEIETIKEYRDNLLDLNSELLEVRDDVQEKVMETFDAWNEKLQDGIDKFDHYNSVMENYRNIIDIVGKDYLKMNNQMIKALNQAMIDNSINKVKATKDAYDAMIASQTSAQAAYEDALRRGTQQDIDYWKETLEQIGVEVSDAQENMMQAWEDALQSAADAFELAVESAVDNFEKALLPFGTLDEFSEAYDKQQEVADQYLDDYQKIYELSKLSRDINNSLDDTKIIGGKQKLKDLLEDINDLQEDGVEMSEYDLEYLQKTYDLRMAEIELEQAQRAKDTVRLTRDNEGNWSYAYTTDTSAVDDAAQKYEDALYAMQDLSSNYIDEMSEQLISTSQDMEEALAAVRVEDYTSIEEYYKKLDEIQQYYLARMKYMQDEMQQALDNNKDLYEQDWKNYSDATGYKISDNEDFMMSYKDTVLGSLFDSEDDIVDFQERVNSALGTEDSGLIGELLQAYEQWSKNTDDAMIAAGSSSEGFAEDMANAVEGEDGILDQSQSATDAVDDMANQMIAGFDSITTAVDVWQSHYSSAMEQVIKDNLDVIDAYNLLLKVLSSGSKQGFVSEDLMNMAASLGNRGSSYNENTNSAGSSNASSTRMPTRFASGGYTGEWGPDGRWALLDEKEMVLNANDTSNLLSTVSVIQDILRTIDLNAQFATNGLGALTAGFIKDDFNSTLEQNVHIQAEFPNVQDHNEVELALSNLINTASQYANRKE